MQVSRTIDWNVQTTKEHYKEITLYEDEIVTGEHRFLLKEVLDISYRPFSADNKGLLYLHTNQGMFSYQVYSAPDLFITSYRKLKYRQLF